MAITNNVLGRNLRHWARVYRQHGRSLPPARYCRKVIVDQTSAYPVRGITVRGNRSRAALGNRG